MILFQHDNTVSLYIATFIWKWENVREKLMPCLLILTEMLLLTGSKWRKIYGDDLNDPCISLSHWHKKRTPVLTFYKPISQYKVKWLGNAWDPLRTLHTKSLSEQWNHSVQFSSVAQSCPTLCDPMNHSSITSSQSSLRLTSIESVMPSSHLILCRPLLLLPPIPPRISLFQWVNSSHEVAKVLEFQL